MKNEVSTVIVCNIFPTLFLQLDNFFCKGITRQICSNPRNIGAKKYFDKPDETELNNDWECIVALYTDNSRSVELARFNYQGYSIDKSKNNR